MNKKLLYVLVFIVLIISGCSILNDMWPTQVNKGALDYLGKDPNTPRVQMLAKVKEFRSDVVNKHVVTQLDLKYQVSLDKANYESAMEINHNIQVAEAERDKMIGTIQNPGWIMSLLLSVSGFGLYFTGARQQRPEDYNEAEMQVEVEKRVVAELAKLKG